MIEITCLLRNANIQLDFNGKDGKLIKNFGYGQVLNEDNCNLADLEKSMESGILKTFLKKGWAVAKKINVQGAIIGAPVEFKGISSTEVDAIIAKKQADAEVEAKIQAEAKKLGAKVEEPKTEEPKAEVKSEVAPTEATPKKRTRKPKIESVKSITEVETEGEEVKEEIKEEVKEEIKPEAPKEVLKEAPKEEDDFV
jgi:hypothetical protein